jgi:hypothetical protein
VAKPKVLGIDYGHKAQPVRDMWWDEARGGPPAKQRLAKAKLKSLSTFETRAMMNPLTAGDPVEHDRWPGDLARDYGPEIPNLMRFELADRWRGYFSLIGEPGGCRVWVLYLWDHEEYSRQSGYSKK